MNQKPISYVALAAPVSGTAPHPDHALDCARHLREGKWTPNILQNEVGCRDNGANELERLHAENATLRAGYDAARLEIASLQADRDRFRQAFQEWIDKTDWVQETSTAKELGKHRADVLRERIDRLEREKRNADFAIEVLEKDVKCLSQQMESVGAGGVEPLRKRECLHQIGEPKQAAAQEPAAYLYVHNLNGDTVATTAPDWQSSAMWERHPLYLTPQPAINLNCKSVQKRLATLWGFEPVRQPLTDEQISSLTQKAWSGGGHFNTKFARAIEAAHGITTPKAPAP